MKTKLDDEPLVQYDKEILAAAFCKRAFFSLVDQMAARFKNKFSKSKTRADQLGYEAAEKIFEKHFLRRKYSNYNSFRASRARKL